MFLGLGKAKNMIKPFAVEFQPLINDINDSANAVRECADGATMERIKGVLCNGYDLGKKEKLINSCRKFGKACKNGKTAQQH